MFMSISGLSLRTSTSTHSAETARPAAIIARVLGDPHPQVVVSLIASSTVDIPTVISAAASQLMRPGVRTGDSGMKRHVATAAMIVATSGIQNSQW